MKSLMFWRCVGLLALPVLTGCAQFQHSFGELGWSGSSSPAGYLTAVRYPAGYEVISDPVSPHAAAADSNPGQINAGLMAQPPLGTAPLTVYLAWLRPIPPLS